MPEIANPTAVADSGKSVPRIRTFKAAYAELKRIDPQTAVTMNMLRQAALDGELPVIKSGTKRLVNVDVLFDFLKGKAEREDFFSDPTLRIKRVG